MKKIACFIEDGKFYNIIKDFCSLEDFEFFDLKEQVFEYDHGMVVIIAEQFDQIKDLDIQDIPFCLIGSSKVSEIFHYNIDPEFSDIQLRALIDNIYQGGILGTFSSNLILESLCKEMTINNDIFNVDRVVNSLTKELVYFFTISEVQKLRIGISEILTNAIEHGNLNISGDEKFSATEDGVYFDLVEERLSSPEYKERRVKLLFQINSEHFKITIEDEGSGFVQEEVSTGNELDDLLKLHGRGILITKMYFDEVVYNDAGNQVTLYKRFG